MSDHIQGRDNNNNTIWEAREVAEGYWIGTGIGNTLLLIFTNYKNGLAFFLAQYPGTQTVGILRSGLYHHIRLEAAAEMVLLRFVLDQIDTEGGKTA